MYALLVLVSLVLIVAGSHVVLSVLGHVEDWRQRAFSKCWCWLPLLSA